MIRSLRTLEQEWFEKISKNELDESKIENVNSIYVENELLHEKLGNFQKELDEAKIFAEKAKYYLLKKVTV